MSNDRIFLRCPVCKDVKLLYKYYPSGGYEWDPNLKSGIGKQPELTRDEFMDQHIHDCGQIFTGDLEGNPFFELCTESPEVWEHIQKMIKKER